jgi:3-oxoacyl-[acyl-carrier-protein] synthase III
MDEDIREGLIQPGDLLLLAAMGAGAHFGAALIRW